MNADINDPLPAAVTLSPKAAQSWEPAAHRYRDLDPNPMAPLPAETPAP